MADHQQQDSHQWNDHSASASASAGSPTDNNSNDPITSPTGPDPTFPDLSANASWNADQNQFTPPLDSTEGGEPFDGSYLFNWNPPLTAFPEQSLQFRPRLDGLPQFPSALNSAFFGSDFAEAVASTSTAESSRLGPPALAMSTLTPAQAEQLKNIAMPAHLQYQSPKSEPSQPSPQSSIGDGMKLASPDPSKPGSRKRKSSADEDDLDDEDDEDGQQPVKKTAHNMIEKRYRTNLNDKIAALRDSVPSLRVLSKSARGEDTTEDREELHGLTPAHKLNKATVRLD